MDNFEREVDDILTGVSFNDKISKYYEHSPLSKNRCDMVAAAHSKDVWPLCIFLTPPSSPEGSPQYEDILFQDEDTNEVETLSEVSRTKDLKSMLIRDCMWNGESPKKGRVFEKLRPLTKTPPLVDCNLRITYVDPSEIWPFHFNENVKAGKCTPLNNNSDNNDEEVEVDVVSVDVSQKTENCRQAGEENAVNTENPEGLDTSCKPERNVESSSCNTDHDYSCKLRSGVKRRLSNDSDVDDSNEQKKRALSGDESDPECEGIGRATHNVLERKRRNELKLRFQYLRDSIPDIRGNDRAPKVSILQKAYKYTLQLQEEERRLVAEMRSQKRHKEQLLKKVLEMQNDILSF